MKEWIMENLPSIILSVLYIVFVITLWFALKGKYRSKAKQMLLALVIAAEERYGGGTGDIKFSYVAERLYEIMPSIFHLFFTSTDIAILIDDAVKKMKEYLSNNEKAAAMVMLARKDDK